MIDILFVHVGKHTSKEVSILVHPMGLFVLADRAERAGWRSYILNYSFEKILNPNFSLVEMIKKLSPQVVAFSLHWHPQSFSTIQQIKEVKQTFPELTVLVGGFTATYFAFELIKNFKEIDFIIRGDAEVPLELFLQEHKKVKRDWSKIPNLVWREGKQIILNPFSYKITPDEGICFTNLSLMPNFPLYLKTFWNSPNKLEPKILENREQVFFYNPGRGCRVNCSICGGSAITQRILTRRKEPVFFKIPSVIRELKQLVKLGIERVYLAFDPLPMSNTYYLELFDKLIPLKLPLKLTFECWGLPSKEFIQSASAAFREVTLSLFVECASERLRKLNKGYSYTNTELFYTLELMDKWGVDGEIYLTLGLPGEGKWEREKTLKFCKWLEDLKKYMVYLIITELVPGAPMFLNPDKFKIKRKRKNFIDFYNAHQSEENTIGYSTIYQKEEDILSSFSSQLWFHLERQTHIQGKGLNIVSEKTL